MRLASDIIRLMSQECLECRTITNDEGAYCDACGSRHWRGAPDREGELNMLNWVSLLLMLGLIALSYWLLVWRIPIK